MLARTVISDGASKTWAMTGWRIGFVAEPCAGAGVHALDHQHRLVRVTDQPVGRGRGDQRTPQDAAEAMRASFLERRDLIVGLLNQVPGFTCKTPGGAFYAWPNVTKACKQSGCADSEELRKRLLYEAGVAVLADIHFGRRVPGDGQHIRFSYAASPAMIRDGVARIDAFMHALPNESGDGFARQRARPRAPGARQDRHRSGGAGRAQAYLDAHARGPAPAFEGDRVVRFIRRAGDMESTVARVGHRNEIPAAVAALPRRARACSGACSAQKSHRGVCWPEFADLDWAQAGLSVEARPTVGDDRLGITGVFCAIAETGTLVVVSGTDTPTATTRCCRTPMSPSFPRTALSTRWKTRLR